MSDKNDNKKSQELLAHAIESYAGRIVITTNMRGDLKRRLKKAGHPSGMHLLGVVRQIQQKDHKVDVGLSASIIDHVLKAKTLELAHWLRLNEAIDMINKKRIPTHFDAFKIAISINMQKEFGEKLSARGGLNPNRLVKHIEDYEAENNLEYSGINSVSIRKILNGKARKFDLAQWVLVQKVIDTIPATGSLIRLTGKKHKDLLEKIAVHGRLSPVRLGTAVEAYEQLGQKESVGLTLPVLKALIHRKRPVTKEQWTLLNETLDALPEVTAPKVTAADRLEAKNKRRAARRVVKEGSSRPIAQTTKQIDVSKIHPASIQGSSSRFAQFTTDQFSKQDAVGDSMNSLLHSAERAYLNADAFGVKAALRKFAELFMHHALLAIDTAFLERMHARPDSKLMVKRIIHDYKELCASVMSPEARTSEGRRPSLSTSQIKGTFQPVFMFLAKEKPNLFSEIPRQVKYLSSIGNDVHIQMFKKADSTPELLIDTALALANAFSVHFIENKPQTALSAQLLKLMTQKSAEAAETVKAAASEVTTQSTRRGPYSFKLEDLNLFKEKMPVLLTALNKKDIERRNELGKKLEEDGFKDANAHLVRFFDEKILNSNTRNITFSKVALAIAKLADLPPAIAYSYFLKEGPGVEPTTPVVEMDDSDRLPPTPSVLIPNMDLLSRVKFLADLAPELLAALRNKGVTKKTQLLTALAEKHLNNSAQICEQLMQQFLDGQITNKRVPGNLPTRTATLVAEIAGLSAEEAYGRALQYGGAPSKAPNPANEGPTKPQTVSKVEMTEAAAAITSPVESVSPPAIGTEEELIAATGDVKSLCEQLINTDSKNDRTQLQSQIDEKLGDISLGIEHKIPLRSREPVQNILDIFPKLGKSHASIAMKSVEIINKVLEISPDLFKGWREVIWAISDLAQGNGVGSNPAVSGLAQSYFEKWKHHISNGNGAKNGHGSKPG